MKPKKRKNATGQLITDSHDDSARRANKAKARSHVQPLTELPSPPSSDQSPGNVHTSDATHGAPDVPGLVREIVASQKKRVRVMKIERLLENPIGAIARSLLGWNPILPAAERARISKDAKEMIAAIDAGATVPETLREPAVELAPFIVQSQQYRRWLTGEREGLEDRMRELAALLPAYPWVQKVKGLGELGLAVIVGEAGRDLREFKTPGKLWRRLGLAPPFCYEERTDKGRKYRAIPRRRRSAVWTITDSLLRQKNDYYDLYHRRRLIEVQNHPEFDNGTDKKTGKPKVTKHCDRRARRYAEKRMVLHLWVEWRKAAGESLANADTLVAGVPPAA
jgi:hypothetical protein